MELPRLGVFHCLLRERATALLEIRQPIANTKTKRALGAPSSEAFPTPSCPNVPRRAWQLPTRPHDPDGLIMRVKQGKGGAHRFSRQFGEHHHR